MSSCHLVWLPLKTYTFASGFFWRSLESSGKQVLSDRLIRNRRPKLCFFHNTNLGILIANFCFAMLIRNKGQTANLFFFYLPLFVQVFKNIEYSFFFFHYKAYKKNSNKLWWQEKYALIGWSRAGPFYRQTPPPVFVIQRAFGRSF